MGFTDRIVHVLAGMALILIITPVLQRYHIVDYMVPIKIEVGEKEAVKVEDMNGLPEQTYKKQLTKPVIK